MQFSGVLNIPKADIENYIKDHKKELDIHARQAARRFVRAAISKIPIVTGMARGSYLNIGRFLNVAIPLTGKQRYRFRKRHGKTYKEKICLWYYPPGRSGIRIPKTPESGAKLTAFKMDFEDRGGTFAFVFEINTRVFHYTLQDEMHVKSPTSPWQSMRAGREAWMEYIKTLGNRLPPITNYIVNTTISFGRNSHTATKYGRLRIRKSHTESSE